MDCQRTEAASLIAASVSGQVVRRAPRWTGSMCPQVFPGIEREQVGVYSLPELPWRVGPVGHRQGSSS